MYCIVSIYLSVFILFFIFQLLCKSLDNLVLCEEFSAIDRGQNLLQLIASLHVIYHIFESDIMWFGQLVSGMPQILQKLESVQYTDSEEMVNKY